MIVKVSRSNIRLSIKGILSAYLVRYPSIIPAHIVKGTVLRKILNEFLKPILKELNRE